MCRSLVSRQSSSNIAPNPPNPDFPSRTAAAGYRPVCSTEPEEAGGQELPAKQKQDCGKMPPPPPVNPQRLSPAESRERTLHFFHGLGVDVPLPASAERADAYAALVRAIVSSATVSSSRVTCTLTISPGVAVSAMLLSLSRVLITSGPAGRRGGCRTSTTRSTAARWRPWPRPSGWRARGPPPGTRRCSSASSAPRTLPPRALT